MRKIKLILYATNESDNKLEKIAEDTFFEKENRLFLLPSPNLFGKGVSLSVKIEEFENEK